MLAPQVPVPAAAPSADAPVGMTAGTINPAVAVAPMILNHRGLSG